MFSTIVNKTGVSSENQTCIITIYPVIIIWVQYGKVSTLTEEYSCGNILKIIKINYKIITTIYSIFCLLLNYLYRNNHKCNVCNQYDCSSELLRESPSKAKALLHQSKCNYEQTILVLKPL